MPKAIQVQLIGFGEYRPSKFRHGNHYNHRLNETVSIQQLMKQLGFEDPSGLILMLDNTVIPEDQWLSKNITNEHSLTVMSAMEGG